MKDQSSQNEAPGQGHTKEQYRFAATLVAACSIGFLLVAAMVGIIKLLKYLF